MPVADARWWSLAGIVLAMSALACDSRQAEPPADTLATRQGQPCIASEPAKFLLGQAGSTTGAVDLECDGIVDSITVSRVNVVGVAVAQLRVGDRAPYLFRNLDGVPTLVEAVDIDGDGVRDLLLALIDESTVLPLLVRVTSSEMRQFDEGALDWRQLQYVWAEGDDQDSCLAMVAPRSGIGASGHRYVRVRASLGDTACAQAPSVALVVRNGIVRVDSLETHRLRTGQ